MQETIPYSKCPAGNHEARFGRQGHLGQDTHGDPSHHCTSKRVLARIATARSPVRNISAVAKVVGRGVRECVSPAYDRYLAPMRNNRQAISTEVSCEIAANHCSQAAAAASVIAAIACTVLHSLQTIVPSASLHACCCMRASCGTTYNTYVLLCG